MGCDIHFHIEIKVNNQWHHWNAPYLDRSYSLFGRFAGVRDANQPHPPVRGLPDDVTIPTRLDYDETFGHTASWITWQEFDEIQKWYEDFMTNEKQSLFYNWHKRIGYLFGNDYHPTDEVTDIRMVFWFDN